MKSMRIMIIKIMVSSFLHEYKCMKCNLLEPVYYSHGRYTCICIISLLVNTAANNCHRSKQNTHTHTHTRTHTHTPTHKTFWLHSGCVSSLSCGGIYETRYSLHAGYHLQHMCTSERFTNMENDVWCINHSNTECALLSRSRAAPGRHG